MTFEEILPGLKAKKKYVHWLRVSEKKENDNYEKKNW